MSDYDFEGCGCYDCCDYVFVGDDECTAEMIDGAYDFEGCGCYDCCDALHQDIESQVESGNLHDADARIMHARLSARGYRSSPTP